MCLTEKVLRSVLRPATFRIVKDVAFELNDTVVDIEE